MSRFAKEIYGNPFVDSFIAKMEGIDKNVREFAYRDSKNSKSLYSHITGGIILPTFDRPGYLLTIGVRYEEPVKFDCIDEFESDDAYEIIEKAQVLQSYYGKDIIQNWWGDPLDLMSIVNEINIAGNPVRILAPIDYNQTDNFQIYTARIKTALNERHKTLFLLGRNIIRNHIMAFTQEKSAKTDNNPAMHVLGSVLHTILIMRPWERAVESDELIPTTFEDYANYQHEQSIKYIQGNLEGGLI